MFPEGFIQRLRTQNYLDPDGLLRSLQEPSPISIRLNKNKWDRIPHNPEQVAWCSSGYYLESRPSFTADPLFHAGCYYPQEASGMFIEQIFRQHLQEPAYIKVLDLCGAPGGKTTHLASLIGRNNLLVSNEVIASRASVLSENVTKWGLSNTIVTQSDPSAFGRLPGFFDLILVDAPCSGEGMFRDPVAVVEWSDSAAMLCSERQKRILSNVWPALKPGGILIYSTCTFNPAENEENVEWLAAGHNAKPLSMNISSFKGITEVHYKGIEGYGFYPGRIRGEGLFVSVVRKEDENSAKSRSETAKIKNEVKRQDLVVAGEWTSFPPERIIRWGEEMFYVPCEPEDYFLLGKFLRIVNPGTRICTVKKNSYIPSHDLALSAGFRNEAFYSYQAGYEQAVEFLRKDPLRVENVPGGFFLISYKGVNLGFCNNIGSRVNNYYPTGWRIRMQNPGANANIIRWND
ncbi:MAG TPA: rRNA cytosine-C5-methyltransferase [Bacteroidales bacterium]|nr:rRNA cytosine-C5-methyltransferase [Bacteroidales bacterium]